MLWLPVETYCLERFMFIICWGNILFNNFILNSSYFWSFESNTNLLENNNIFYYNAFWDYRYPLLGLKLSKFIITDDNSTAKGINISNYLDYGGQFAN